ncbi:MAG: dTMP kinase [Antricoccus sp.]
MPGLFISFEGGEGVGKTTQIAALSAALGSQGRSVVTTREPGGTPLGAIVRTLILSPESVVSPRAEALLYAADRAHHVDTVIEPALAEGKVVISDRYVDSTLAYQGAGRSLRLTDILTLSKFATADRWPDLTILLDADPRLGLARARGAGAGDRIEAESLRFHQQVRAAFLDLAAEFANRFVVIDASSSIGQIQTEVLAAVTDRLIG